MDEKKRQERSDQLLKMALEQQFEEEMAKYMEADPHEFSERFNQKMEPILEKAAKKEHAAHHPHYRRRIAVAAGFALTLSLAAAPQAQAFRVPIKNLFMKVEKEYTYFGVRNEDHYTGVTERFREYEPKYVPLGFQILEVKEKKDNFYIKYYNESKEQSYKFYFSTKEIMGDVVDTEDTSIQNIDINGQTAILIQKKDEIRLLINKSDYHYYLSGNLPLNEAKKVFESLNIRE